MLGACFYGFCSAADKHGLVPIPERARPILARTVFPKHRIIRRVYILSIIDYYIISEVGSIGLSHEQLRTTVPLLGQVR